MSSFEQAVGVVVGDLADAAAVRHTADQANSYGRFDAVILPAPARHASRAQPARRVRPPRRPPSRSRVGDPPKRSDHALRCKPNPHAIGPLARLTTAPAHLEPAGPVSHGSVHAEWQEFREP